MKMRNEFKITEIIIAYAINIIPNLLWYKLQMVKFTAREIDVKNKGTEVLLKEKYTRFKVSLAKENGIANTNNENKEAT
jgi:hypothetical protein